MSWKGSSGTDYYNRCCDNLEAKLLFVLSISFARKVYVVSKIRVQGKKKYFKNILSMIFPIGMMAIRCLYHSVHAVWIQWNHPFWVKHQSWEVRAHFRQSNFSFFQQKRKQEIVLILVIFTYFKVQTKIEKKEMVRKIDLFFIFLLLKSASKTQKIL